MNEKDILSLIESDVKMMEILRVARSLKLQDWWIGAGFVRGKVWDHLHGFKSPTPLPDIDVIYFDTRDFNHDEINSESTKMEKKYESKLRKIIPNVSWSVTNQARMHHFHPGDKPYNNSTEALSNWVETATCIGMSLNEQGDLKLTAPHGIDDLVNLGLKPVNRSIKGLELFHERITKKRWLTRWPKLRVVK